MAFSGRKILLLSSAAALLLTACLGTQVKSLGNKSLDTGNPTSTQDAFTVTLAYRDTAVPTNRVVAVQGATTVSSQNFVNNCGSSGASCTCDFYTSTSDTAPVSSSAVGFSETNNSISCTISGAVAPATYTHVRLRTTDSKKITGFIPIKTTLTIEDILGGLDKANVHKIFRYDCQRSFFEGEGVNSSANTITCVDSQHLGIITASYSFYIYSSNTETNIDKKSGDIAFSSSICGYQGALKVTCGNLDATPRYGLYKEAAGKFTVAITLTPAPEGATAEVYGYAALPDSSGNCPTGLVKIRPFQAQPASMIVGYVDATSTALPYPTTYINSNNTLNNNLVEVASSAISNFTVNRASSSAPCASPASSTNCTTATFNTAYTAQSVAYTALTPIVCAIPDTALTSL